MSQKRLVYQAFRNLDSWYKKNANRLQKVVVKTGIQVQLKYRLEAKGISQMFKCSKCKTNYLQKSAACFVTYIFKVSDLKWNKKKDI